MQNLPSPPAGVTMTLPLGNSLLRRTPSNGIFMTRNEKIAAALVVLSCLLYAGLLGLPFLAVGASTKAALACALVVGGESVFWLGTLVAGRELMRRYRTKLWPQRWFR